MKKLPLLLLLLVPFLLTLSPAYAWTSYTHKWICDKVGLNELDCTNADNPVMQSEYTDINFNNHHCANNATDCDARKVADKYVLINNTLAQGFAAHLYADSMTPVHWYSTDYDTCHKIFEDKVEEKLRNAEERNYVLLGKNYNLSTWNLSMRCTAKFGKVNKTVELYADNYYMDSVVKYVAEKMGAEPTEQPNVAAKEYDLTPILMVLIVFIILVFVLFFYVGLRNKKIEKKKSKKK